MKKIFGVAIAALLTAATVSAQNVKEENIADFATVNFTGKISVEVIPSDENKVEITLQDADASRLVWGVNNGVLSIRLKSGSFGSSSSGSATAKVYCKTLASIQLNGAEAITQGVWKGDMLSVDLSNGAKLTTEVSSLDMDIRATGNSIAQFSGTTKYITLRANTRSKVDARKLRAMNADVTSAAGAEVYVFSEERLVADASVTATIFYLGKPSLLKLSEKLGSNIFSIDALPAK